MNSVPRPSSLPQWWTVPHVFARKLTRSWVRRQTADTRPAIGCICRGAAAACLSPAAWPRSCVASSEQNAESVPRSACRRRRSRTQTSSMMGSISRSSDIQPPCLELSAATVTADSRVPRLPVVRLLLVYPMIVPTPFVCGRVRSRT